MFIGTLFSDRVDRDNPIDLRFHRNLETSTRKFLEIHLKLSESENADRAIGNQISDINLEMLPKKCWSSIQSSSSIAHKQIITCNNNAFVPVCQFLEEHRLETSNLQKQWFSHHMDFLSLSTLIDCQKRQAKTNHCCWNRNYNMNTHNLDNKKCKC